MRIDERFDADFTPPWDVAEVGAAKVTRIPTGLRLTVGAGSGYSNAQIADYSSREYGFRWKPAAAHDCHRLGERSRRSVARDGGLRLLESPVFARRAPPAAPAARHLVFLRRPAK
jgi:hypothetical protein